MKKNLYTLLPLVCFVMLQACTSNKNQTKNTIDSISTKESLTETNGSISKISNKVKLDLGGYWSNQKCNISFDISKNEDEYRYTFKSDKRTITNSLDIINQDHAIYLKFNGIPWSKNQVHPEAEQVLPTSIEALYNPAENNFVIQNYGNSSYQYLKLEEGCEKYIHFEKGRSPIQDTLHILSNAIKNSIKGYTIRYWEKGDITNDQIDDFIIVMQSNEYNEELTGISEAYHRKVVLLETTNFPNFKIRAINDHIIECSDCGGSGIGDPFSGITIKNNYFSFEQLFGSCAKNYNVITFKSTSNDFFLHSIGNESYSCHDNKEDEVKVTRTKKTVKDFGTVTFKQYIK